MPLVIHHAVNNSNKAIRLWYDDTTMHSTTMKVIEIMICVQFDCKLRYDYDVKLTCSFFARIKSHRMEAGDTLYLDRSRIIVESQL